ncbi:hypothetical protein NCCP2222_01880 [Sporosarcina sp. NCCP-2222]|uniref:hypothetical protein n=1 Tax=Sporosarcina sp. NCCP-2222 TaxID=2935073 RepID=UPI00208481DE|nr:hypothetical protein [Sporosarcina sp. NCCP-2222]GKV54241.1 hypothetical protein NCCP2222_01880 [Sporosarcina sp. NCCP-2222]
MALGDQAKEHLNRKRAGLHLLAVSIGKNLEAQAKRDASWKDRTGNTRRAIHGGGEKTSKGAMAFLAHGSMVGTYLEEGTGLYGPHRSPIVPKNANALRFTMGGRVIFAKQTKGMPAQPIIRPTADKQWPEIKRAVRKYWEG